MVLEIVAAVGGSIAFAKYLGPLLYHECFAPTSDDDLLLNAGLFPTDRSPLLTAGSPSPRADSLRLATELYDGHLEDWLARQRNGSPGSTPAAITDASGASTPLDASPSPVTPGSAASSYFDLRQPPLYINDVQVALERERRNSNEFGRANALAGFRMASVAGDEADDGLTMMKKPSFVRRFSNQMGVKNVVNKSFSEETAWLTSSLVCLLHSPDLSQFFLSGAYLDEDVDSKYHRAIIESFASAARFFWPSTSSSPSPSLDLTAFHAILKRSSPNPTAAPTPLSSSPSSPRMGPLALSSSPSASSATTLVDRMGVQGQGGGMGGAQVIANLLKALHVALNEGEWTSDQPTYLRSPYQLSSSSSSSSSVDADDDADLKEHVGFLRNVQSIQEDSIVRDVFEGLVCVKTECACGESVARFEGFSVLPLPAPLSTSTGKKPTLGALLKAYERPRTQAKPQWCGKCASWALHEETRRIWSLPSTVIFQLPSATTSPSAPASASSSRTNSPYLKARRLSGAAGALAGMTPITPAQVSVEYPVEGLDLTKFSGERRRNSSSSYDLSSDSGESSADEDGEAVYDLFAVRESRFKVFARDPVGEKWAAFDAGTGAGREVRDLREVVTPHADLLFYRRRE